MMFSTLAGVTLPVITGRYRGVPFNALPRRLIDTPRITGGEFSRQRITHPVGDMQIKIRQTAAAGTAVAQNFPSKPVRIIVPFAPGGSTDIVARLLAPKLSEHLGQTVIVDNRGGGGTTIGMDILAKSPPDGHTLGVATLTFALNPSLFSKLPYNTERDFAPVSLVSTVPFVMAIHPSVPARSVQQMIALAKAKPGSLNFSSSGNGSASQMAV